MASIEDAAADYAAACAEKGITVQEAIYFLGEAWSQNLRDDADDVECDIERILIVAKNHKEGKC